MLRLMSSRAAFTVKKHGYGPLNMSSGGATQRPPGRPPAAAAAGDGAAAAAAAANARATQLSEFVQRQLGADVIDLAAGQPSPGSLPLELVAQAAAHRLSAPGVADPLLLQYGAERGYKSFRVALAGFLREHAGSSIAADELMVTAGNSFGIDLVCRKLAAPGDVIASERPTYFLLRSIIEQNRLASVGIPTDDDGLDVDALAAALASGALRPRLVYLVPTCSNPTGATLPLERRKRLIALAHEYGFDLVCDEVYQLLSFPGERPPPPMRDVERQMRAAGELPAAAAAASGGENVGSGGGSGGSGVGGEPLASPPTPPSRVVSLGSFSKMLAPGLRLGWAEACDAALDRLRSDGVLVSGGCIAPLSSAIAHSTIELGLLQQHLHGHVRPTLAARCNALCAAIDAELAPLGCSYRRPAGGYFVWLRLPAGVDAGALNDLAAARHGARFAPGPLCLGPASAARLSFAFYGEAELKEGVSRLAAALREALDSGATAAAAAAGPEPHS